MAHSLSAKKRIRQSEKRRARNRSYKTRIKNLEKKVLSAVESKNKEEAENAYIELQKSVDSICRKGIIHQNAAARKKSRLKKLVNSLA